MFKVIGSFVRRCPALTYVAIGWVIMLAGRLVSDVPYDDPGIVGVSVMILSFVFLYSYWLLAEVPFTGNEDVDWIISLVIVAMIAVLLDLVYRALFFRN